MLTITLQLSDEETVEVDLEHSLLSMSKWEQKYEKPFFGKDPKTPEETADYIEMMVVGDRPIKNFSEKIKPDQFKEITNYINGKMTATWFRETNEKKSSSEVVTTELMYFWLVQFRIPFHPVETWHVNRLMTLVRIAGVKQTKPKPMSKTELAEQYRNLNQQRREQLGTKG